MYLATMNVPGYLPMGDPVEFDSAEMAWDYLASERNTDLDNYEAPWPADDAAAIAMDALKAENVGGSVWGTTPGYDGDHDLGLVYSVTRVDE